MCDANPCDLTKVRCECKQKFKLEKETNKYRQWQLLTQFSTSLLKSVFLNQPSPTCIKLENPPKKRPKKAQWLHQHRFPGPLVHPRLQDPLCGSQEDVVTVVTHQTELTWYSSSCNILVFNICVLHQNILSDHPRMRLQTPTGAGKKSTFRLKYNSLLSPEQNDVKISWQTSLVSCSWYNLMTQSVVPSVRMDFTEPVSRIIFWIKGTVTSSAPLSSWSADPSWDRTKERNTPPWLQSIVTD